MDIGNTGNTGASNLDNLLSELQAGVAPQNANAQIQYNLNQQQINQVNPELQQQLAYNQAMSGYQGQNLQLSEQQLGISQLANQQQQAQAGTQQQYEQAQYGLQAGQYPEQQAEAALAYQNSLQQTQGGQAISGTQNTVGGKQNISTLGQQYGFQTEDIARQQALSQLGQGAEQSGYQYSQEQLQNAQQNLALIAQGNGVSQQQMATMLNYGNTQATQGAQQNLISLLSNASNIASGQGQTVGPALSLAGFAGGGNGIAGLG